MGLIVFICLSFDIFHLAVFCHINICIVKQTYINLSVCSLHTCEIHYLIMGLCVHRRALICKYHVFVFYHLIFSLTTYDNTESCIAGLVD